MSEAQIVVLGALKCAFRIDPGQVRDELTTALKRIALRTQNMDHIGGLAFELQLTADLLQRGLFRERIATGFKRLKEGESRATERLVKTDP